MIILATLLILSMAVAARAEDSSCSYSRAAGDWIITDSGTVFVPEKNGTSVGVPRAAFGKVTLDSGGNLVKGVATSSLNGVIADETFHGTYTVNPDSCMGTITAFIFSSGSELFTVTLDIVFEKKWTI
jgi:hypothetical protein